MGEFAPLKIEGIRAFGKLRVSMNG